MAIYSNKSRNTELNTDISATVNHSINIQEINDEMIINDTFQNSEIDIRLFVDKEKINQIFLFYTNDSYDNYNVRSFSELVNSDLLYTIHAEQWNPKINTTINEMKNVTKNYIYDLLNIFIGLENINDFVVDNYNNINIEISNIFQRKIANNQRERIILSTNGYFSHKGPLKTAGKKISDSATNNLNNLTRKILEKAEFESINNPNSKIFSRQFDSTNTSNRDYNLPPGWRSFKFVNGDTISFDFKIKQPTNFFIDSIRNPDYFLNGATDSLYKITFIVTNDPSGVTADFTIPTIDISAARLISDSSDFKNVISNILDISDLNVISSVNQST